MSGCCDDGTGIQGPVGPAGESAYQVWLDEGNVGTEQDFLDSLQGVPGNQGPQGIQGNDGATGATGVTGSDGPMGDDGSSYLTGSGNPSLGLGEDGDTYSNNINGEIWTRSAGVWTFTGYTLKGVQGAIGPIGLTGATGAAGANGTNGVDGDDGLGYDDTTSNTSTDILDTADTTVNMSWSTGKAFIAGSRVRVADSTNPSANYFEGVVNIYDAGVGTVIVEDILNKVGTGTLASWNVSITGDQGATGTATLAATLLVGNTTGASDIDVNAGQNTRYESPATPLVPFAPAAPVAPVNPIGPIAP